MSHHSIKAIMAVFLVLATSTAGFAETFVIRDGKAVGKIVTPAESSEEIKLAAEELTAHLKLMTGAQLEITTNSTAGSIRLALSKNAASAKYRDSSDQSFVIDQKGDEVVIEGMSQIAILYGAYEYLNDLDVRWFMPGDIGTHVPKRASVTVNGQRKEVRPGFRLRSIWLNGNVDWHWDKAKLAENQPAYAFWMTRNRLQVSSKRTDPYLPPIANQVRETTGHNIRVIYKWRKLTLAKNPERFPLVTRNGEKTRTDKGQICFTHPDNLADSIAWCLDYFAENPHMVSASMSLADTGGICECDGCTKANGGVNPAVDGNRLVWGFMNEVAQGIAKKYPDKGIAFYSGYGATSKPPEGMKAAPNIVGAVAHIDHNHHDLRTADCVFEQQHLAKFAALKATGADMFARDYSMYPASLQPLALANYVKTYHELGCVGYTCEVMARSEQHWLVNWAQAQLAWNPRLNPRQLIEEYCLTYFGDAGTDVLAVVDAVEASVQKIPKITLGGFGSAQEILTDEVIAFGRKRLDAARSKVTGVYSERLTRFHDSFELYCRLAEAYRALFVAIDDRTEENQKAAVAKFDATLAWWKERDLGRICSPTIVPGWIDRVRKTAVSLGPINPKPHALLVNADEAALRRELFSLAQVPDKIDGLTWLPSQWKFRIDLDRRGEGAGWMHPDFDDSKWVLLEYNLFDDQGFLRFEGTFWYRTAFDAPKVPTGKRIIMRFGALDDDGKIFVNGKLAHSRLHLEGAGWKRSFEFDVTDSIKPGERNVVAVCGRNDYGKGGLWKPVAIYTR